MKKKSFESVLYSVAGVAIVLLVLVAFNALTATVRKRIDLTKDKAFTLSEGTRAILKKLDTPVKIRFYFSGSAELTSGTIFLKTYAQHVQDLLAQYRQAANGKIIVEQFDPKPDSDAEDSAHLDGVEGEMLPTGEKFYMGLCVSMLDGKQAIPFLDPRKERSLEYDLSRSISSVGKTDKPVIGIMSALPVFGAPSNPMMARMGQQGSDPWYLVSELQADYTVKPVEMTSDKIDDDIKVLMVIQPRDITDKAQYAIDQFIMRGGKLIAFLDGCCLSDRRNDGNPVMAQLPGGGSTLDKLFKAWGVQFDDTKVLADMTYMNRDVKLTQADNPGWIQLTGDAINKDDLATSEIDKVWIPFGGAFTATPAAGLKETVLLSSSKDSQLTEGMMAVMSPENAVNNFAASGTNYALAIRLTGKFKTAFPNGKPEDKIPGSTNAPPSAGASLKETREDNSVVLFGDSDMLADQFTVRKMNSPFGLIVQNWNANLALVQNIVEQFSGDNDLIYVRSRATLERPFTRINEMYAEARKNVESKIRELDKSLQETRQKLSELQSKKDQGQRFVLSPEQQAEIAKFRTREAETNKQKRDEEKKLARDVNKLENTLKWSNIFVMPGLVTLSGICLAVIKRKRVSAK